MSLERNNVLGIDPGLTNWLTCVSNVGTSFIVDGLRLKSMNRWYNKQVSTIKEKNAVQRVGGVVKKKLLIDMLAISKQ